MLRRHNSQDLRRCVLVHDHLRPFPSISHILINPRIFHRLQAHVGIINILRFNNHDVVIAISIVCMRVRVDLFPTFVHQLLISFAASAHHNNNNNASALAAQAQALVEERQQKLAASSEKTIGTTMKKPRQWIADTRLYSV